MIKTKKISLFLLADDGVKIELSHPAYNQDADLFYQANMVLRMWTECLEDSEVEVVDILIEYEDDHQFRLSVVIAPSFDLSNIKDCIVNHLKQCYKTIKEGDLMEQSLAKKKASEIEKLSLYDYQVA